MNFAGGVLKKVNVCDEAAVWHISGSKGTEGHKRFQAGAGVLR